MLGLNHICVTYGRKGAAQSPEWPRDWASHFISCSTFLCVHLIHLYSLYSQLFLFP